MGTCWVCDLHRSQCLWKTKSFIKQLQQTHYFWIKDRWQLNPHRSAGCSSLLRADEMGLQGQKGLPGKGPINFSRILHCISHGLLASQHQKGLLQPHAWNVRRGRAGNCAADRREWMFPKRWGVHKGCCSSTSHSWWTEWWDKCAATAVTKPHSCLFCSIYTGLKTCALPQLSCSTAMVPHTLVVTQPPLSTSQMLSSSGQKSQVFHSWHSCFFPPQRWDGYNFI